MSREQRRLVDYLTHILEAIERIDRYTHDLSEVAFLKNELIQDAVVRNLEIVGEASNNIEKHFPEFSESHADIPFSAAYQMRNMVAHGYFKVDWEIVWKTIDNNLPSLYQQIHEARRSLIGTER
jgi:uncharacterized protein with HEPN domain